MGMQKYEVVDTVPEKSGVYAIKCVANGCVYVGSSVNMNSRCKGHIHLLRKGEHHNTPLQEDFNKHGIGHFVFMVLEECAFKFLSLREDKHLSLYKKNTYNVVLQNAPRVGHVRMPKHIRNWVDRECKRLGMIRESVINLKLSQCMERETVS